MPPGSRVLEVGCGTGDILVHLRPSQGTGLDLSTEMVKRASRKYPAIRFLVHDLMDKPLEEQFDYIVAVDVAEHVADLDVAMASMARMLAPRGKVVVTTANPQWAPVLHLAERLGLKMPEGVHEWRSQQDLLSAAQRAGLIAESSARSLIVPKAVPLLKVLNTAPWTQRLVRRYGLILRMVFAAPDPG